MKKFNFLLVFAVVLIISSCNSDAKKQANRDQVVADSLKQVKADEIALHMKLQENAASEDPIIREIRKEFQRIENTELEAVVANYQNPDWANDRVDYIGYYEDGQLVKLSAVSGVDSYTGYSSVYLKNDMVFFVYTLTTEEDAMRSETRIYFHNGQIIEALVKEGEPPLTDTKNNQHPMMKEEIIASSKEIIAGLKMGQDQYESLK